MFIANADGTGDEKILETTSPTRSTASRGRRMANGIVYETYGSTAGSQLFEMRLSDHTSRKITDKVWCCGMGGVTWTSDGSSLILWGRDTQRSWPDLAAVLPWRRGKTVDERSGRRYLLP
jgi:hypothetical protein